MMMVRLVYNKGERLTRHVANATAGVASLVLAEAATTVEATSVAAAVAASVVGAVTRNVTDLTALNIQLVQVVL